jgi:hypothetical protein
MSDEIQFAGFGIEIINRSERYYLRYDAGELVVKMVEIEITEDEAGRAQLSEKDAYEVILAHQLLDRH